MLLRGQKTYDMNLTERLNTFKGIGAERSEVIL